MRRHPSPVAGTVSAGVVAVRRASRAWRLVTLNASAMVYSMRRNEKAAADTRRGLDSDLLRGWGPAWARPRTVRHRVTQPGVKFRAANSQFNRRSTTANAYSARLFW